MDEAIRISMDDLRKLMTAEAQVENIKGMADLPAEIFKDAVLDYLGIKEAKE